VAEVSNSLADSKHRPDEFKIHRHLSGELAGPGARRRRTDLPMSERPYWHDDPVQQEISGTGSVTHAWVEELPEWSLLSPVGYVDGHWQWRGAVPGSAVKRAAAWGYRAQRGAMGEHGVLGARFEPHERPYLRVFVAATLAADGRRGLGRFGEARAGLPLEYVGAVLAGALQEPDMVGPGTLTFDHAAVHEIDSSWQVFRLLAIGVVRLLGLPPDGPIPADLLPRFGGSAPESPGAG
jgi:hypothetical protein